MLNLENKKELLNRGGWLGESHVKELFAEIETLRAQNERVKVALEKEIEELSEQWLTLNYDLDLERHNLLMQDEMLRRKYAKIAELREQGKLRDNEIEALDMEVKYWKNESSLHRFDADAGVILCEEKKKEIETLKDQLKAFVVCSKCGGELKI